VSFNFDHKAVLDEMLLTLPEVRAGKMFGYPAYFAGEKCCSCVYENGVSLKIPEERVKQLLVSDPNFAPFIPMGGGLCASDSD
jgi:signal-transduction protein with cAMP-binding, CBS, and nucleotidyltransferase domain